MSAKQKISFIGGDARQSYMVEQLNQMGFQVMTYALSLVKDMEEVKSASSLNEALDFGTIIIGPVPFSKNHASITSSSNRMADDLSIKTFLSGINSSHIIVGGCFGIAVKEYFVKNHIRFLDLMTLDTVITKNAVATAEGAIAEAISRSPVNLHKSSCLVLGYGKCATVLASKLKGLDALVTVTARKQEALESAASLGYNCFPLNQLPKKVSGFTFLFNTIPAMILDKNILEHVRPDSIIIDIASCPGGVDQDAGKQFGITSALCLGLPGKYAPKTSADILVDALLDNL